MGVNSLVIIEISEGKDCRVIHTLVAKTHLRASAWPVAVGVFKERRGFPLRDIQ